MAKELVCTSCGYIGKPKRITKGNIGIEIILWLTFIIPGLIYSLWRLSSRYDGCAKCKNATLVPKDSPVGQKMVSDANQTPSAPQVPQAQQSNISQQNEAEYEQKLSNKESVYINKLHENNQDQKATTGKSTLEKVILGIGIAFGLWIVYLVKYFLVPVVIAIILYVQLEKRGIKTSAKVMAVGGTYVVLAIVGIWFGVNASKAPVITILEPTNEQSIQSDHVTIKGTVKPRNVREFTINNKEISHEDGIFEEKFTLPEESNKFVIVANKKNNKTTAELIVNRIFTQEELDAREQKRIEDEEAKKIADAEQKKRAEEAKAKRAADKKAWDNSKAGQYCKKYPDWTKEDCTALADNKIWVGMSYEMLVERRGKPSSNNQSNYGSGNRVQWCWMHHTPRCFYDDNGDGLVDAYN